MEQNLNVNLYLTLSRTVKAFNKMPYAVTSVEFTKASKMIHYGQKTIAVDHRSFLSGCKFFICCPIVCSCFTIVFSEMKSLISVK